MWSRVKCERLTFLSQNNIHLPVQSKTDPCFIRKLVPIDMMDVTPFKNIDDLVVSMTM